MDTQSPPTNDVLFDALTDVIQEGNCIAIIGAGVSADDYPLWDKLVSTLQNGCGVRSEDLTGDDFLDIAEVAKKKNRRSYFKILDDVFSQKENPKSLCRYHMLSRIKFSSYITLNYDSLLLDTIDLHRDVTVSQYPSLKSQHHGKQELFYIHGRLGPDQPASQASIVLTRAEFEEAYNPYEQRLHAFLQSTFLDYNVCFIGCNPDEPHMKFLIKAFNNFSEKKHGLHDVMRPKWFLLWDGESDSPELLKDCGIHMVKYPRRDKSFSGLDQVLEYWANRKKPVIREAGVEKSSYDTNVEPEK